MTGKHKKSIVLLHKTKFCDTTEIRQSLGKFCLENNQSIIDIVNFSGIYDYIALRRLSQVTRYGSNVILLSNKDLDAIALPLVLWSVLEKINSPKITQLMLDFEESRQDYSVELVNEDSTTFKVLNVKEVELIADLICKIRYEMDKGQINNT